jgi:aromatic ring hydroxylase
MLAARSGQDHLESLRDGRDVSINGERVADVTIHEAFRNCVPPGSMISRPTPQTSRP